MKVSASAHPARNESTRHSIFSGIGIPTHRDPQPARNAVRFGMEAEDSSCHRPWTTDQRMSASSNGGMKVISEVWTTETASANTHPRIQKLNCDTSASRERRAGVSLQGNASPEFNPYDQ